MAEIVRERQRTYNQQDGWDKFWKDKHGKVVVWQRPSPLLIGWLVLTIVSLFTNGTTANILWYVALGVLAVWALLEVTKGVNYLRRLLGIVVLALIVFAVLKVGA